MNLGVAAEPTPQFTVKAIDADSTFHSCAAMDVNRDGALDVVTGGWWYEGPSFQRRHFIRDVPQIRGRYDDYACLPLDVNQDGKLDFVSANYRSESIYWVQQPGVSNSTTTTPAPSWQHFVVDEPGPMETGRLADVDGDGRLDLLPNGTKFAAWWSCQPGATPTWTRHPLPDEVAGHGIGIGDINSDGRDDIITAGGWAEAPPNRRSERWVFHPDFTLHRDASIPIIATDVDQDGDTDIVWGRGHQCGIYWLEQTAAKSGGTSWRKHTIDTSWSQAHSLLWGDINGDGLDDLIAGKRYLGHDGKDLGEYDPLVAYFYTFQTESKTWRRLPLARQVGFGLDPKLVDIDRDGDLDIICADRSGLYVIENHGNATDVPQISDANPVATTNYDHRDVLTVCETDQSLKAITKPQEMGQRRHDILLGMQLAMGTLPASDRRSPVDLLIDDPVDAGDYLRHHINYQSHAGNRVPAWLLLPKQLDARTAAILCLHQTTAIGKDEPAGLGGNPQLHYAHELASRGFICLVPDYPSFGEYAFHFADHQDADHQDGFRSGSMRAIWNNMRAIDVLEQLPQVDHDRIAVIGHSLGGHTALFTAAFDTRIKAVVTSCGFTAFASYYGGNLTGWSSQRYMPRIRDVYGNSPAQVPFDFHEVLAAIAPRPIWINAPQQDDNFDHAGVLEVVNEARRAYRIYGQTDDVITVHSPACGHEFPDALRDAAYQWLGQRLR
ncbi:MAG: alpha/beta fold hydrolase [Pirellulaceae bacterium]|nr:alpha/beta fold hydrolase [Planctomycetales bacterium]